METPRRSTWLITGASSGFGLSLASLALKAGHKVIGGTRNIQKAKNNFPGFQEGGGIWFKLDPGSTAAYDSVVELSDKYDIDVLVNNAGYAFIGGVEDTSEDEMRAQMEVNFYGPIRLIHALLPKMRVKRSGNVVLISSGAGFEGKPGRGTYAASKWAVEAMHESLSYEVEKFGIKILIVEPGAFRTPFSSRLITPAHHEDNGGFSEPYRDTIVEKMVSGARGIDHIPSSVKGDPEKVAKAILDAVEGGFDYLRLPLGNDCIEALERKINKLTHDLEATRAIASSTDAD